MKKLVTIVTILCMASFAFGQWGWDGGLGNAADTTDAYGQGIAVDGEGKIWYTPYYASETVMQDTGSGSPDYEASVRGIYVFNPDGSPADFSPISIVSYDGNTDTLFNSNRGLEQDPDGNVVAASYWEYYRFSPAGQVIQHLMPEDSTTLCKAAFTADGELMVSYVLPGNGISLYDTDFELIDKAVPGESTGAYARSAEIAPDGSALYYAVFTAGYGFLKFNSSDGTVYGNYMESDPDTLLWGLNVESCQWHPTTGYLWAGNTGGPNYTNTAHYAFDPANDYAVMDSIIIPQDHLDLVGDIKPRGIDFSADGTIAYINFFNSWDSDPIYKFVQGADGVWEHEASFAVGYELKANYPNPFNPSTNLTFKMKHAGEVDMRVFDIRGAEVAVLANGYMSAGEHTVTFDGSDLAAGMYVAQLRVNGVWLSQNMLLVK